MPSRTLFVDGPVDPRARPRPARAVDPPSAADARPNPRRQAADRETSGAALVRRVLRACGHHSAALDQSERQFDEYVARLRGQGTVTGGPRRRAATIHAFMHAEILRGKYEASASDLASALRGGPYNCVSVTALSLALAREFGVDARPVSVVGHVWCRIQTENGPYHVETTCADWFTLAKRRAALTSEQLARQPDVWQEHDRRVAAGRELDETAFTAVFHYNRGVRLLREGRFFASAGANLWALTLDWRCEPAYGNLIAAVRGWTRQHDQPGKPAVASAAAR